MSDFLKSISSPFVERARSPIVGPFLVSWSIINWKIIYITVFLSNEILAPLNKLDFVYGLVNWCRCFWLPLVITLVYIFLMPFVDRLVMKFTEYQKRKNLDLKLEIGGKFRVDGNKFYDLKGKYDKQRETILNCEEEKVNLNSEIVRLESQVDGVNKNYEHGQTILRELEEKLQRLSRRDEIKHFFTAGRWFSLVNGQYMEDIEFSEDGKYYIIEANSQRRHAFNLVGVDIDIDRKRICFTKMDVKNNQAVCYNQLGIIDNDRLEGVENGVAIRYEKRKLLTE